MKLSHHFLTNLQQRLKVGNRSGVHLNAVPGRSRYKFDVHSLGKIWQGFPQHFLDTLLRDPKFRFAINFDGIDLEELQEEEVQEMQAVAKKLNNLAYQIRDIELEKGINTFGFGYPLLVRKDHKDGKITVAPLLIWSLQIIQDRERYKWTIVRSEDDPVLLNEVLLNHLESDAGITLHHLHPDILEDRVLDREELKAICIQVLEKVNHQVSVEERAKINQLTPQLSPIPSKKELEAQTQHLAYIHWGGLFSVFEMQKESILRAYEELIQKEQARIETDSLNNFAFQSLSSVPTDPSQQGILNALKNRRNLVVHGPPGTGKSQTLTAIITNALENHKTVLVVCEKRTALEVIHQNLRRKGLANFSIILRDEKKDRRKVVEEVRNIVDEFAPTRTKINASKASLQAKVDRCELLIRQINDRHAFIHRHFLEDHNWSEVVGKVLEKRIQEQGTHFTLELHYADWEFSIAEYQQTESFLAEAEQRYQVVGKFLPSVFRLDRLQGDNPYALEDQIKSDVKAYQEALEKVLALEKAYQEASGNLLRQTFAEQDKKIQSLLDQLEDLFERNRGQADFKSLEKTSGFVFQTLAFFSKKRQALLADQQLALGKMWQLQKHLQTIPSFAYQAAAVDTIPEVARAMQAISERRKPWRASWDSQVEVHRAELRSSVLDQGNPDLPEYQAYQQALRALVDRMNGDGWLARNFQLVPGLRKDTEGIRQELERVAHFFADPEPRFAQLFDWASFVEDVKPQVRALIILLVEQKNWGAIFSYHYLETLLKHSASTLSITKDHQYQSLREVLGELESDQIDYIQKSNFDRQLKSILRFNQQNEFKVRNLYNKRRSEKHARLSLRKIVHTDFALFTSFFPIVLTSPTVACTLFYGMDDPEPFDIVLFDEASQLRVEETLPALLKGKQKIVAGDEHQMPPSNYFSKIFDGLIEEEDIEEEENPKVLLENQLLSLESLLELAIDLNFDNYFLDFHYRSRHPQLIDFSNAAFYQQRLQPMPGIRDYRPIQFVAVEGIYHAGCNPLEAEALLDLLQREVQPNEQGQWPSVGIATFNLRQRNLLLQMIREKALLDPDFAQQITVLEKRGLFVKNLENIQGDERDIIFLSTTYGKDAQGKFRQNFGPINHRKGYKLLNVIITRAKYKIYLCTSIDAEYYLNYQTLIDSQGNNRRGIFYAYLAYAQAVSEGDEAQRQIILQALSSSHQTPKLPLAKHRPPSPFEQQVYQLLVQHFSPEEVTLQFSIAGLLVDLVYQDAGGHYPPVAIECDGAWYPSSEEAYAHDLHRQQILEQQGFLFYRIWSTDWWRNHERELQRLIAFIKKRGNPT